MRKERSKETTETGLKILQITAEHGYVTAKEIEQISKSEKQAFRYIKSMNDVSGFIEHFNTGLKPLKAFYVTKKGANVLSGAGRYRVVSLFKPCDYGPLAFYHNLAVIHARLAIEKHPQFYDFETPRVLMARVAELPELKPDAEVVFKENLVLESRLLHAGLEVELHPKSHKRNVEKIRKYDASAFSHLKSVIWVCSDNAVVNSVTKAIKEKGSFLPLKHRFILYKDLLEQSITGCRIFDYTGNECEMF